MKAFALNEKEMVLNAVCPYFTMFPLTFPFLILKQHAKKGELIFDPFCGRGTTNFASRLNRLPTCGMDSSPIAYALSKAKLANTNVRDIVSVATEILESKNDPNHIPKGQFWKRAYQPKVLRDLCALREGLLSNCRSNASIALRAIILGGLHGPLRKDGSSFYFSNQCPRTYAPKPNYALNFWRERDLAAPKVNVLELIKERAQRYYGHELAKSNGLIVRQDSRNAGGYSDVQEKYGSASWIITSPPYYGMRTYIPDQWLRNWFMGGSSEVDYSNKGQLEHSSPEVFAAQLKKVWINSGNISKDGARMVMRCGGLSDRKVDPLPIFKKSLEETGWKILTVKNAGTAKKGKRQADTFLKEAASSTAMDEYDIWARWEGA